VARFVIVGAGLAGAKAAEAVRERSADTEIVLVGDEPEMPYERPPLSKGYLKGESPREEARVHTAEWYPEHRVDLRTGVTATAVDTAAHTVTLADGTVLSYDKLLLATGSHARTLPFPGADAAEVYTLRRADDADRLKDLLGRIRRLCRWSGSSAQNSQRSSPTCTASTASTSGSARPSPGSPPRTGWQRASNSPTAP